MRIPKRLGIALLGISGLFGMRTPPEPQVIAQMVRAPRPEDTRPPRRRGEDPEPPPHRPGPDDGAEPDPA